jgi:hypothetical protein
MFEPTSRYYNLETKTFTMPDGREVAYVARRFIPDMDDAVILGEHMVVEGERLDNITARALGDPQQFWRIADANYAMNPFDLTAEIGRKLVIAMPQAGQ